MAIQLTIGLSELDRRAPAGPSFTPTGPQPAPAAPNVTAPRTARGEPRVGVLAPVFSEHGVLNGQPLTNARLRGSAVLLFFGTGVACRTCLEQMRALQRHESRLRLAGLMLVNVTSDPSGVLRQAVRRYHIAAPTISDAGHAMSSAYGMPTHGAEHTFVLIDRTGRIRWRHDYPMVYVQPERLLAAAGGARPFSGAR